MLAAEQPDLRVYWFDPGDMRTQMHQDAFPGEDISDRPLPETVVPALLPLLRRAPAERPLPRRRRCWWQRRERDRPPPPSHPPTASRLSFDLPPELEAARAARSPRPHAATRCA